MTIAELRHTCNAVLKGGMRDVLLVSILIISCILSFGLGFLAHQDADRGGEGAVVDETPLAVP